MLSARMNDVDGVLQLYADPDSNPNVATALNFLEDEIDFTISAKTGGLSAQNSQSACFLV